METDETTDDDLALATPALLDAIFCASAIFLVVLFLSLIAPIVTTEPAEPEIVLICLPTGDRALGRKAEIALPGSSEGVEIHLAQLDEWVEENLSDQLQSGFRLLTYVSAESKGCYGRVRSELGRFVRTRRTENGAGGISLSLYWKPLHSGEEALAQLKKSVYAPVRDGDQGAR